MDTNPACGDAVMTDPDTASASRDAVASHNLMQLNQRTLTFIRQWPVSSMLTAVALGFIVGKIAARY